MQIQNFRDRSVNNDIAALASNLTSDKSCTNLIATQCVTDYSMLANTYATNTTAYTNGVSAMNDFVGQTTDIAGNQTSVSSLLNSQVFGTGSNGSGAVSGCVRLNTDCGFIYTPGAVQVDPTDGQARYEVWTCRVVPSIGLGFSVLGGSNVAKRGGSFYAIGHAIVELGPASDTPTDPGTAVNPLTGALLMPASTIDSNLSGAANVFNYADLNLQTSYVVPRPAPPSGQNPPISTLCNPASIASP